MTDSLDAWAKARRDLLEIENPLARCGHCGHVNGLDGTWSVEDGRLVFRADANPLTSRGPDFHGCSESSEVTEFKKITVDDKPLTPEQVAELQAVERAADEAEYRRIMDE
jgi:hypothetical protein